METWPKIGDISSWEAGDMRLKKVELESLLCYVGYMAMAG
jgi:hypothetical protein